MKLPEEKIIGGWAEVWRNDRAHSTRIEVSYDEYVGLKKDGTPNRQWAAKPATMIRKVALAQALREAFPSALGGMFTAEEQGQVEELPMVDFTDQAPDQTALPEPEPAETALAQSPEAALFAGKQ